MFDKVIESLRKATETNVQMQQEMFKKWVGLWPGMPAAPPSWGEQVQKFQAKWAEVAGDLLKRQQEAIEAQFRIGVENIEKAFRLGEVKTTEDLQTRTIELWQKCFESLRQAYEVQLREFQTAIEKWSELVTKAAA
jgi:hypothetical protein